MSYPSKENFSINRNCFGRFVSYYTIVKCNFERNALVLAGRKVCKTERNIYSTIKAAEKCIKDCLKEIEFHLFQEKLLACQFHYNCKTFQGFSKMLLNFDLFIFGTL